MQNTLKELKKLGVSPWYDNIERRLIKSGSLKELIDKGVLGLTSNPTIFEKAINSSSDYDGHISVLTKKGFKPYAIYDELTVEDIREAADLLRDIYETSGYVDGYVSIEVLPEYAHDAKKTVDYGRYIFKKINRPNVMVKVPGTQAAFDAIRTLIREGINVNATLLFSVKHYQRQAEAYILGLEDRCKENKKLNVVNSVASIFVSRIDTKVDSLLNQVTQSDSESLKGKGALANSALIYKAFKQIFTNSRFALLKEKGAKTQRVLWASTGTKNPEYSDIKYVDGLIAPDTINTMPQATLESYLDHGRPSISIGDSEDSSRAVRDLSNLGIDIDDVCDKLQDEGLGLFEASFNKLLASFKEKMEKMA